MTPSPHQAVSQAPPVLLVVDNRQWRAADSPFQAIRRGLHRLGHRTEVAPPADGPLCDRTPKAVLIWNGVHGRRAGIVARYREAGARVLILERGFFDRNRYTQIDPAGFNHTASWAASLAQPAPDAGAERFRQAWGADPEPVRRRNGYALILLQCPGDAQVADSPLRYPSQLVRAVESAAPQGLALRVRAHPIFRWHRRRPGRARMIEGTLADAVAGAAFCVTINSNAGNEALARGRPVLALGPSLYARAGAAMRTGLAGLDHALDAMADGWTPEPHVVGNYLHHLACRQWTAAELAEGTVLQDLLDEPAA